MMRVIAAALFVLAIPGVAQAAPPGPIAGTWRSHCPGYPNDDLIIRFTVNGTTAKGTVEKVDAKAVRGYKAGELILDLHADDFGQWIGKLKWRGASGTEREDFIRLEATGSEVHAVTTTDDCYKSMTPEK